MLSFRCASFFAGSRWLTVVQSQDESSNSSALEGPSGPSVLSLSASDDLEDLCDGTVTSSSPARSPLLSSTCYLSPSKGLLREGRPSFGSFNDLPDIASITRSQSLENILEMLSKAEKAVSDDILPVLSVEGTGGTYFVSASADYNTRIGVFKPSDEEVSLEGNPRGNNDIMKTCIPVGESWKREIAAYRLDHGHFAGVPETIQLRMPKHYFHSKTDKIGSFQRFVPSDAESWDVMPACLPTEYIQRIAILDIRMCNSDRHGGNVLVCRGAEGDVTKLVPIDHGCCFPTDLTELEFEWLLWKQSKSPFSTACKHYIASLNGSRDAAILENELGIDHTAATLVRAATLFLQTAALTYQLTAYDIGTAMRRPSIGEPSPFELAIADSREALSDGGELDFILLASKLRDLCETISDEKRHR
eukprot:TRINITY_DN8366_c1_g1_i1.p1 TRINITY_DN8366_c1_g1~~TRINITY_DN8366_c1_g1_i1.p1  ORF type:complete len:418 (+),score=86.86 TRINITY_DN8366_c1_g1_i1:176-1429(+)